ncbi:putative nuclease HARBI1 [Triplophysa rosa]|uniref:Putative nuclease HARBI1 n=1 Tax=Triplophysa rosa TaxID=992332 RepID=A0A9W7WBA7_TRIRA|nr:putative nuclease HARBI1 [Triplophysa rosa]KAI7792529.1 putative nuclease HARBI1 [Triplophysa rosa]
MSSAGALWFAVQDDVFSNACIDTPATLDSETRDKHPSQSSTSNVTSDSERHSLLDRFDDSFLLQNFHLNRQCLRFIVDYMHSRLKKDIFATSNSLMSTEARSLAAVYFHANGSLSNRITERLEIDLNEAREAVKTYTKLLSDTSPDFITFPSSYNDRMGAAHVFKNVSGIPHVVGVLGYFHVKVTPPPGQEQMFVNTLGYHSAMMQVIFDLDGNILSLEQCCPGGTPEHSVWASTVIGKQFTTFQHGHSWVLGGRGLFGGGHVLTPIMDPSIKTKAVKRFNKAHALVYGHVQQVFGVLKSRFQCLRDIGSFQTLKSVAYTVKACCVLHNISKKFSVPLPCDCILEPIHPPSSVVTSAAELPYDYMEDTKNEMIEMIFGHAEGDVDDD